MKIKSLMLLLTNGELIEEFPENFSCEFTHANILKEFGLKLSDVEDYGTVIEYKKGVYAESWRYMDKTCKLTE